MDLYQLEYFRVLCKFGSFTKASQALMVTQPAISIAVKKLEEEYGELINRKSKGFALTQVGEILLKWSESIHKEVTNMSMELNPEFQNKRKTVKIALPLPLCPELITELVTSFVQTHPDISIQMLQKGHIAIANDLVGRAIDVGVLCKDMLHPMLAWKDCRKVEFYACFSPNHRFSQCDYITPDMLADETLILSRTASSISGPIQAYFDRFNINPNCEFPEILPEDARKLAGQGAGVAFRPKHIKDKYSAPLSPPLYCELVVAWLKGNETKPVKELIDFIVRLDQ